MAGVTVPADTKILIGEVTSVDVSEPFAHEKLSPVLALYKAKDFDTALDMSEQLIADGGYVILLLCMYIHQKLKNLPNMPLV